MAEEQQQGTVPFFAGAQPVEIKRVSARALNFHAPRKSMLVSVGMPDFSPLGEGKRAVAEPDEKATQEIA